MSLILPDEGIEHAVKGWYYKNPGYEYERALCRAQARHMARECLDWWDGARDCFNDPFVSKFEAWLRQEGVL